MTNNQALSFDRAEEIIRNRVDAANKVSDAKSYIESLDRPTTGRYVAMPDGTVEFLR